MEQNAIRNFNATGTIGAWKYRREFAFFEIPHNFGKFPRNSLSLLLHNTVKLHVLHGEHVLLLTWYAFCNLHGKRVVVGTVYVLIFTHTKAIVSTVLNNTKDIFY